MDLSDRVERKKETKEERKCCFSLSHIKYKQFLTIPSILLLRVRIFQGTSDYALEIKMKDFIIRIKNIKAPLQVNSVILEMQ